MEMTNDEKALINYLASLPDKKRNAYIRLIKIMMQKDKKKSIYQHFYLFFLSIIDIFVILQLLWI